MLGATAQHLGANNDDQHGSSSLSYTGVLHETVPRDGLDQNAHVRPRWLDDFEAWSETQQPPTVSDVVNDTHINDETSCQSSETTSHNDGADSSTPSCSESSHEPEHTALDCLLCNRSSSSISKSLAHMRSAHSFFVPEQQLLSDSESFLNFLSTTVRTWHQCLSCGVVKASTAGVQSHMRDKGHFQLNFEREPELWDFWSGDSDDDDENDSASEENISGASNSIRWKDDDEMHLPNGKVIHSKNHHIHRTNHPPRPSLSLTIHINNAPAPAPTPSQSLIRSNPNSTRRTELSLAGVSHQALRAIAQAEKQAQRSEAMARKAKEWVSARGANTQKFDQMDTTKMGKRGKQTHKLLPR